MNPEAELARRTRRSFLTGGIATAVGFAAVKWLSSGPIEQERPAGLRRTLENNEKVARTYFKNTHLSTEYPKSAARMPKSNGDEGLEDDLDASAWRLMFDGQAIPIEDIQRLPRTEHVTELRCVEGWSQVVHWAGVRFSDFAARYAPQNNAPYVSMETPDGVYYVGLDRESAMHPQTLLCYEMNGAPLEEEHGAPLRLVIPVKYGIKNIKRIGTIRFTQDRPRDYWAERGYDWYAGL